MSLMAYHGDLSCIKTDEVCLTSSMDIAKEFAFLSYTSSDLNLYSSFHHIKLTQFCKSLNIPNNNEESYKELFTSDETAIHSFSL